MECAIWLEKVIRRTLMSFVISIINRQLEAFVPKHVVHNRCVTETALGRFVLKYLLEDNAFILRWLRLPSEGALLDGLDVVSNLDVDQYQFQDILLMLINGVVFHEVWFSDRNKLFFVGCRNRINSNCELSNVFHEIRIGAQRLHHSFQGKIQISGESSFQIFYQYLIKELLVWSSTCRVQTLYFCITE